MIKFEKKSTIILLSLFIYLLYIIYLALSAVKSMDSFVPNNLLIPGDYVNGIFSIDPMQTSLPFYNIYISIFSLITNIPINEMLTTFVGLIPCVVICYFTIYLLTKNYLIASIIAGGLLSIYSVQTFIPYGHSLGGILYVLFIAIIVLAIQNKIKTYQLIVISSLLVVAINYYSYSNTYLTILTLSSFIAILIASFWMKIPILCPNINKIINIITTELILMCCIVFISNFIYSTFYNYSQTYFNSENILEKFISILFPVQNTPTDITSILSDTGSNYSLFGYVIYSLALIVLILFVLYIIFKYRTSRLTIIDLFGLAILVACTSNVLFKFALGSTGTILLMCIAAIYLSAIMLNRINYSLPISKILMYICIVVIVAFIIIMPIYQSYNYSYRNFDAEIYSDYANWYDDYVNPQSLTYSDVMTMGAVKLNLIAKHTDHSFNYYGQSFKEYDKETLYQILSSQNLMSFTSYFVVNNGISQIMPNSYNWFNVKTHLISDPLNQNKNINAIYSSSIDIYSKL